ncbi:MAG: HAD-IA family hydrolase [Muribaculaceae bacterium]|nr:HAD-IA family hydrolase [Muribaculaceae bacterium]
MRSIIFDLDLTLIDTTVLESLRHSKQWQEAYRRIPETIMYDGISHVLDIIRKHNIPCAIVSTSPRPYVEKIVTYYNLPIQHIVAYHDAKPVKPHPAPMLKALELMGKQAKEVISFGDRVIDIQASNAAGIESVACFWGTKEKGELIRSDYSHAIVRPEEIITLIR